MHPELQFVAWLPGHTAGSCWAYCQSAPPHPFLLGCSPTTHLPVCACVWCFPFQVQNLAFSFSELHTIYDHLGLQSIWVPLIPPENQQHLPSANLLRMYSTPSSRSSIKIWNKTGLQVGHQIIKTGLSLHKPLLTLPDHCFVLHIPLSLRE